MSNYNWAFDFLPNIPTTKDFVLDVGAFDLMDARTLVEKFDANVIAFEADPDNLAESLTNLKLMPSSVRAKIKVVGKFLGEKNETIDFFAIDSRFYNNKQASSKYQLDFSKRPKSDPDHGLSNVQKRVQVESIRYDSLGLPAPHSIFMDVQGSELEVLRGIGEELNAVQNVVLETSFRSNYMGSSNFSEIHQHLTNHGFSYIRSSRYKSRLPLKFLSRKKFDFDVLYSRIN